MNIIEILRVKLQKRFGCLQTGNEETKWVKESKIDMLTIQYEKFVMIYGETIFEMNSRSTIITNELRGRNHSSGQASSQNF